jgi:HEAT repeat protein
MTANRYHDLSDAALIERMCVLDNWDERDPQERQEFIDLRATLVARLTNDFARLEAALSNLKRLNTEIQNEAYWAVISAGHASTPQTMFDTCVEWVAHPDPFWRCAALDILAQLGPSRPMHDGSMPIIFMALRDKEESVVTSALFAIGHLNTEAPAYSETTMRSLNNLVASPSAKIRRAAVSALSARNFPAAIPGLIKLTCDTQRGIRDWATFELESISELDTKELRDALIARLNDEDDNTRQEAMVGLAQRKDMRAAATIRRELEEDIVTPILTEAITELPDPDYIPLLERSLAANPGDRDILQALTACRSLIADSKHGAKADKPETL